MGCKLTVYTAIVLFLTSGLPVSAVDSQLADVSEIQDFSAIVKLLEQGVSVDAAQPDGATALHWAVHWDNLETVKRLISAGASINVANDYGITPLFLAATNGSAVMMDALLAAGGDPNASLPVGETVLMSAVRGGNLSVVEQLLASGADPAAVQESKGQSALMWAATRRNVEIARALLNKKANIKQRSTNGFTPLMFAAREGSVEMSSLLLTAGADLDASSSKGITPLLAATVRGHVDLAMFFLDQGAKADGAFEEAGYTPLHWAASMTETPLTYQGIDAPGEWGALSGIRDPEAKADLIKALLANGADIEARITKPMVTIHFSESRSRIGGTPFFTAASSGDAAVMRLLADYGADPLARSSDGSTPFIVASGGMGLALPNIDHADVVTEEDRIEAMELALELGNDLKAEESRGYRALHHAASAGFHNIVQWLLDQGADINAKSQPRDEHVFGHDVTLPGQTPLGVVEGYCPGGCGALWVRPQTAEFLRGLGVGAISEGKVNLQNYIDRQEGIDPND